jgi:competence protein ComEC
MKWLPDIKPGIKPAVPLFHKKTLRNILIFIVVTISATLGTMPLIVFYFNRVSTISLLANVLVVPVLGIIAIPVCTFIIITAMLSSTIAIYFIHVSSFLAWISVAMVDYLSSLPGSAFFISTPTPAEIVLYYCVLISGVKLLDMKFAENKKEDIKYVHRFHAVYKAIFIVSVFFVLTDVLYINTNGYFNKNMKVTAIDVGQGSSILVQIPEDKVMLVDGGGFPEGNFDVGKYVVSSFLWHERINTIDIVVLTHPHPDHLNGLIYILSNFKIGEVWTNGDVSDSDHYREFKKIIEEKKIHHRFVSETNTTLTFNRTAIDFLNPSETREPYVKSRRKLESENDRSVVMKITYGNVSLILPGDISEKTEDRLVNQCSQLRGRVLFVPHHGGATSSSESFIEKIHPEIAVVSCGINNIYKFPHAEVLKRYSRIGAKIFRTDKNGAVAIVTDGNNMVSIPFLQGGL